ncbi:MAG: amidohydrolase family protein [Candidatus Cloacimonetes bacterium]|nr:amidohydrolase family protein [Candidatus Cloacimonadota bacterium]MDY0171959.1 amidohydrolase family protein [Candidatus Cloacimonadaceae bacterium]
MSKCDTIIKGGSFITMDPEFRILSEHFMVIDQGRIVDILPLDQIKQYKAKQTHDAFGCLVTPGFINAHSHMPMSYFRGLADDLPLHTWLKDYIWPLEAKMMTPDFVYDASLHSAAEMILNGITLTNDMYFQKERIADACIRAGMRVLVSEAIIAPKYSGDGHEFAEKLLEFEDAYRDQPLVGCTIAPHAIYTCSAELYSSCARLAADHGWLLHTHLSETQQELEDCLKLNGKRPLEYLASLGVLEAKCLFAHGVWLSGKELELLEGSQSAISICTDSNLKLASGIAPLKDMLKRHLSVALGTDGVASNNNLDILEELSTTAKLHKAINADPEFLPARDAFALLTIGGARTLGKEQDLGSLEAGKCADLLIIDLQNLQSQPLYHPYSQLVYALGAEQIRDVMVAGNFVLKKRQLSNLDEAELISTAQEYQIKIQKELRQ